MKLHILIILLLPFLVLGQRDRNKLERFDKKFDKKNGFHTIVLDKNLEVDVFYTAAESSIDFEVDPIQYKSIQAEVRDSVLTITSNSTLKPRNNWTIKVYYKKLNALKCNNDGKMRLHSNVKTNNFTVEAENGSTIEFKDDAVVQASHVHLIGSHRSTIDVKIATNTLDVDAEYLTDVDIEFDRSIDFSDFELIHDCTLDIEGNDTHANKVEMRLTDHSDANLKSLKADIVELDIFENSKIDVCASKVFDVHATGNSRVNIYGQPKYESVILIQGSELVNQDN